MKTLTIRLSALLCMLLAATAVSAKGIDTIRERLIDEAIHELKVDELKVDEIVTTFNAADSIWPGINYIDTSRVAFEHTIHLSNMVKLARAYQTKSSKWYKNQQLREVFDIALAFWTNHDFICANWWNNEIGTPTEMISMLYIMNDSLTAEQREAMLKIASRANMNAWGARQSGDRIRIAGLEAKQHIFVGDEVKLRQSLLIIENEMTFRNRERGLQCDLSFHHRADNVDNTTTYGTNFINAFAEWVKLIGGTEFHFSDKKLELAIDYYLDGVCKHMVYGRLVDMNSRNRDISRINTNQVSEITTPEALMQASAYRHDEMQNVVNSRTGEEYTPACFAKYFWESNYFALQRPNYFTSVRLYSTYNACMEVPYNGEGLLNHYRSDGANFLVHNGYEHSEIIPYLDWQRIPGTTVLQAEKMPTEKEVQKYGLRTFAGGVDDGLLGAVGFDFESPHSGITAKKSWFFFNNEYVCLGTDINSEGKQRVLTTIEQSAINGAVALKTAGKTVELKQNQRSRNEAEWVHHNNVGYFFPEPQKTTVRNIEQVGSWRRANIQTTVPEGEVKGDVFQLYIDHGSNATGEDYSYIVVPNISRQEMERKKLKEIHILQNNAMAQAVKHDKERILYAVFYSAGAIEVDKKSTVAVDQPCIIMVKYDKKGEVSSIYVSDPNRDKKSVEVKFMSRKATSTHTIELPQGDYSGSTVSLEI